MSSLAAYVCSKINGEGRPGRMKKYGMGRRDCTEFELCPREQGICFNSICVAASQLHSSSVTSGFDGPLAEW